MLFLSDKTISMQKQEINTPSQLLIYSLFTIACIGPGTHQGDFKLFQGIRAEHPVKRPFYFTFDPGEPHPPPPGVSIRRRSPFFKDAENLLPCSST
jgi:hypothetical protein